MTIHDLILKWVDDSHSALQNAKGMKNRVLGGMESYRGEITLSHARELFEEYYGYENWGDWLEMEGRKPPVF